MLNTRPPLIEQMTEASVGFHKLDDGRRLRYALLWPGSAVRGTFVIAPGRREFIEKKYIEIGKDLLDRGFRLIIFEWCGQGLSSRFLDGEKRQRDYATDFNVHMHDLNGLYERVIKPNQSGPLFLSGHSMGSHLLLRWMIENPTLPVAGAILTAPMLALAGHLAHVSANFISWSALKLGYGDDYASAQHDYNQQDRSFNGNPLTHDPLRFAVLEKYFRAYPDMVVGGVTWEWMHAAMKSMHVTQRRQNLEAMTKPILTITGSRDRVTPVAETERYLDLLPKAENVVLSGALHDVMGETDDLRTEALRHIDAFLERVTGG